MANFSRRKQIKNNKQKQLNKKDFKHIHQIQFFIYQTKVLPCLKSEYGIVCKTLNIFLNTGGKNSSNTLDQFIVKVNVCFLNMENIDSE